MKNKIDNMPTYTLMLMNHNCTLGTMKSVYLSRRRYFDAFKDHIKRFPIHKVNA